MRSEFWLVLDLVIKAALFGLLAFALVRRDLQRFRGKAMVARAIAYPIAVLIVPAGWLLLGGPQDGPYPYAMDILMSLPFLIDTTGNAVNFYDTIWWWDDANHFVNWGLLVAAFAQFLLRVESDRFAVAGLAVGFGAVTAILWELAEYVTFIRHSSDLASAYRDTLGDLALGLSGSVVAAITSAAAE